MRPGSSDRMRPDIPAIDCEIHDLLMRRAALESVESGDATPAPLLAARSARILRSILARHTGPFPLRALVRIWSDILFAADRQTTLHVFTGEDAAGFRDLARLHFGSMLPIVAHVSASAIVHACADDPGAMGLVPPPETVESAQTWWEQLAPAGHPGPRIVQLLPFVRSDSFPVPLPQGYAIASVDQEPTGRDTSMLRLECHADASRARVLSLLRQARFDPQILAASRESAKTLATCLLVAIRGFVATADERLSALSELGEGAIESVALVGGYADPFEVAAGHES